jgi:hypothetical protein
MYFPHSPPFALSAEPIFFTVARTVLNLIMDSLLQHASGDLLQVSQELEEVFKNIGI